MPGMLNAWSTAKSHIRPKEKFFKFITCKIMDSVHVTHFYFKSVVLKKKKERKKLNGPVLPIYLLFFINRGDGTACW